MCELKNSTQILWAIFVFYLKKNVASVYLFSDFPITSQYL